MALVLSFFEQNQQHVGDLMKLMSCNFCMRVGEKSHFSSKNLFHFFAEK